MAEHNNPLLTPETFGLATLEGVLAAIRRRTIDSAAINTKQGKPHG